LLLLLILPNLVTGGRQRRPAQAKKNSGENEESCAAPAPPKPTTDAAGNFCPCSSDEGRLVDFLREDIQPYDDAQIGAAVRAIHHLAVKC